MVLALLGVFLLLLGGVAILTGTLPLTDLAALADRVAPILLFVVAMTIVTELCSDAGVFRFIARRLRRWGLGSAWWLWLLVCILAVLTTIFLSLDTTAVLLTPIVVNVARQAGLPPLPFALITVWLANTASLLLPISNLTNLLAQQQLGSITPLGFATLMAAPAVVAILVPMAVVAVVYRGQLTTRYPRTPTVPAGGARPPLPPDRVLGGVSAGILLALIPALLSGLPVWIPASAAAAALILVYAVRRRTALRWGLVPWSLLTFVSGLFVAMAALENLGLPAILASLAGTGGSPAELLRLGATGMLGANVANNLPAYLALEPIADTTPRLLSLLVGVNAGPLITPWASLATLLWHDRLRSMNVQVNWRAFIVFGLGLAPLTVGLSLGALILVTP